MPDLQIVRLSNPLYIGTIAPLVEDFYKKAMGATSKKGVSYESLYTYLINVVQNGGLLAEVWIGLKDQEPVAWASWNVLGWPYFGTVYCSCIYNKSKDRELTKMLATQYLEFAKEKKAPYIIFEVHHDAVGRFFTKLLGEMNITIEPTGITQFIGRV